MNEEEITKQYEKGIVHIMPMLESLIDKLKVDKNSLDIQQLKLVLEYLITEREINENYIDALENELNKEKEKNKELENENKKLDKKFRYAVPDDMVHKLYVGKELYEQLKEENQIQRKQLNDAFDRGWIHKDKIRELQQLVHKALDQNGITRAFQLVIDDYFNSILEE